MLDRIPERLRTVIEFTGKGRKMKLIYRSERVEIWEVTKAYGSDFYVYGVTNGGDGRAMGRKSKLESRLGKAAPKFRMKRSRK